MRVLNLCSSDVNFLGKGGIIKTFKSKREHYVQSNGLLYNTEIEISDENSISIDVDYTIYNKHKDISDNADIQLVDFYSEEFVEEVERKNKIVAIPSSPQILDGKIVYTSIILLY